jgi:uncharacterized protein (DUF427 family)
MSLTIGEAPFGRRPGTFNFERTGPDRVLYLEDSPRWVRGEFAGQTVVSSKHTKLMHETGLLPVYYFPLSDVRMDLLEPTDRRTHCPLKGDASYWSIRVGDRVAENAVWTYPAPIEGAPPIEGLVAFYWHSLDHWYEEDEEVFVHARDPFHRIDILPSSRHVKVSRNGELIAETRRPMVLFETGLPPRYYIERSDVRMELLTPTESQTQCPYKGTATYWSAKAGDETVDDLVWCYEEPIAEAARIAGRLAFFNEKVDIELDGELQERPKTKWS